MPARNKISKDKLVKVATDAIAGLSKRDLMAKYPGVSERVIRLLMQNDVGAEEWRTALSREIQSTAGEALLELRRAIREGRISPHSLPVAFGILMDKATGLDGRAAIQNTSVNLQVNFNGPAPKAALLAELDGFAPTLLVKSGDSD